jgi:hypothetical protein
MRASTIFRLSLSEVRTSVRLLPSGSRRAAFFWRVCSGLKMQYRRKADVVIESKADELLALLAERNALFRLLPEEMFVHFRDRAKYLTANGLVYVERVVATPAPNHIVTEFQPTDEIRSFLVALRARDFDAVRF